MAEEASTGAIKQNWLEVLDLVCFFCVCLQRGGGYQNVWQTGVGVEGNSLVYPLNKYLFKQSVPDTTLGARNKVINKTRALLLRGSWGLKYL